MTETRNLSISKDNKKVIQQVDQISRALGIPFSALVLSCLDKCLKDGDISVKGVRF